MVICIENRYRKLRSISDVLHFIKSKDADSAVTRFMITRLVQENKVYHVNTGKKVIIDLDETLAVLGLIN